MEEGWTCDNKERWLQSTSYGWGMSASWVIQVFEIFTGSSGGEVAPVSVRQLPSAVVDHSALVTLGQPFSRDD